MKDNFDSFYYLARSSLVKDERHIDRFDQVFSHVFKGLEKIEIEIKKAKEAFKKYQWPVVDVTRKSVEETAASIIKIYEIYKQNV